MKLNFSKPIKIIIILAYLGITLLCCAFFSFYLTGFGYSFKTFIDKMGTLSLIGVVLIYALVLIFDLLNSDLRHAGISEFLKIFCADMILFVVSLIYQAIFMNNRFFNYVFITYLLYLFAMLAIFFAKRTLLHFVFIKGRNAGTRTMVVGAGGAGKMLIQELLSTDKISTNPVCLIDDDPHKKGMRLEGIKVVGNTDEIEKYVLKYKVELIIVAMPSLPKKDIVHIYEKCVKTKCKVKQVPGLYQFINGRASISEMQEVDLRDLLGREQIVANENQIATYVNGKVVLVTGGGGSIGSELCRQLASFSPKKLIVFDVAELGAYNLQQELKMSNPELDLEVLIGSVRDPGRVDNIFEKYKPQLVFHAAAHKHVPLMEDSPHEAVKNNVFGTLNVAMSADKHKTERFLLISTDKAVNPTNIMGATKRICEMIIQSLAKTSSTEFVAVRFGNVLGSSGSVVPLFKAQIKAGGPVTVTSKNITRYFMTIPEAVSLVLQAGFYAHGGEIFVLDMGEPVKIYDMAVNLIKLSGFEPGRDIKIEEIGLRPGEKMYEERLMDEEGLERTENKLISIGKPLEFDERQFKADIVKLREEAYNENGDIKSQVAKIVGTYKIDNGKN